MDLALSMSNRPNVTWKLAKQMDVSHAVAGLPDAGGDQEPWDFQPLRYLQNRFEDHGLSLDVIESRPPMEKVVLGKEGRDEQIETVTTLIENMGKVGIPVYCWVWTENPLGVLRTSRSVPDRGESRQTGYDHEQMERAGRHPEADITEAELWENLEYFLDRVVPVAEDAGVNLALHPDDPPISPIRGVPRLATSVENYDRILDLHPSDNHGVCLGQGNFALMDTPIPEAIRHFDEKIHFVHFRDVRGTPEKFSEAWHDDGQTDMAASIRAYEEIGFDGPARPDHHPEVAGEGGGRGPLYSIGYMRGLIEQASGEQ